jgi:hypothetical protein
LAELEAELFAFPNSRFDDQVDSVSQALGHDMHHFWDETSVANFGKFAEALVLDQYLGWATGRPW